MKEILLFILIVAQLLLLLVGLQYSFYMIREGRLDKLMPALAVMSVMSLIAYIVYLIT